MASQDPEKRALLEEAVLLFDNACDTDDVLWSTRATGQDTEQAEESGHLVGYRDALAAVNELLFHDNPDTLRAYMETVRTEMVEAQEEVDELDPGTHFWHA